MVEHFDDTDLASRVRLPLNVVLALDASDSVTGERLEQLRTASYRMLDGLERQDQAALVVFNDILSLPSPLTYVTEQTGGRLFEPGSARELPALFAQILSEFRSRYVLSYSPRGVAPTIWHRIDVRVRNRHASVKARAGYLAGR